MHGDDKKKKTLTLNLEVVLTDGECGCPSQQLQSRTSTSLAAGAHSRDLGSLPRFRSVTDDFSFVGSA